MIALVPCASDECARVFAVNVDPDLRFEIVDLVERSLAHDGWKAHGAAAVCPDCFAQLCIEASRADAEILTRMAKNANALRRIHVEASRGARLTLA